MEDFGVLARVCRSDCVGMDGACLGESGVVVLVEVDHDLEKFGAYGLRAKGLGGMGGFILY